MRFYYYLFLVAGLGLAGFAPVFAQSDNPDVARLSYVGGDVGVQRSGSQNNVTAALNAPVLAGDAISTGNDGRAEAQFDGIAMLRVDSNTQVRFAQLDPGNSVVQLAQGTISLDLLHGADGTQQIDTPSISLRGDTSGRYRVTVRGDGVTLVTVRSGSADILFPQGTQVLEPGQTLLAQGPASNPSYRYIDAVGYDAFDSFNQDRDSMWLSRVDADGYAYDTVDGDDLDSYGHWVWVAGYGRVWSPYVATGWAPYRYGQWVWEPGFGWVWVSTDPWGWAPYHYGRWLYASNYGWCWYPPAPRAIWSPALVVFFSFGGPGFNIALGFGNIGWVPLGPWETYRPGWNWGYYRNARYGLTAIDARSWQLGNFHRNVALNETQVSNMHAFGGNPKIAPTANNLRFSNHTLPESLAVRHFNTNVHYAGNTTSYVHTTTVHTDTRSSHPVNAWDRFDQNRGTSAVTTYHAQTNTYHPTSTYQYSRPSGNSNYSHTQGSSTGGSGGNHGSSGNSGNSGGNHGHSSHSPSPH